MIALEKVNSLKCIAPALRQAAPVQQEPRLMFVYTNLFFYMNELTLKSLNKYMMRGRGYLTT